MPASNYYDILGVPETASPEEIKQAYHMYSKKYHPDMNPDPNATAMFRIINEAYTALTAAQSHTSASNSHEEAKQYEEEAYGDAPSSSQVNQNISLGRMIFNFFWFLLRMILAAGVWLLKFPIVVIGVIGYLLAGLAGIGTVITVIGAIFDDTFGWTMALVAAIFAIVLYLLTLLSSFLLELLDDLRDRLLGA